MSDPLYRRVIVKLSGEALTGPQGFGIDPAMVERLADDLAQAARLGVELGVVVGGGNIFRGVAVSAGGVLLAAVTGNPYFTTDTTAVLRAAELEAQAVLKATNVDGVYTADPKKDPRARRYDKLTHQEALEKDLRVMDGTAFALARENRMPIIVFSIAEKGAIATVLRGKGRATVVG